LVIGYLLFGYWLLAVIYNLFDLLSHGFIQRALIAGSFIAILCSTLGVFLVLRRLSLIGDGLAHVTFGSVAVGLLMKSSPFYIAIPIVMMGGLGILKLMDKARLYGDAAIGIVPYRIAGGPREITAVLHTSSVSALILAISRT
jgi:zinc transport system permease protein